MGDARASSMQFAAESKSEKLGAVPAVTLSVLSEDVQVGPNSIPIALTCSSWLTSSSIGENCGARATTVVRYRKAEYVAQPARIDKVHQETSHPATMRSSPASREGCRVIVNTSLNVRGERIVCTHEDAFGAWNKIESLGIGKLLLSKRSSNRS